MYCQVARALYLAVGDFFSWQPARVSSSSVPIRAWCWRDTGKTSLRLPWPVLRGPCWWRVLLNTGRHPHPDLQYVILFCREAGPANPIAAVGEASSMAQVTEDLQVMRLSDDLLLDNGAETQQPRGCKSPSRHTPRDSKQAPVVTASNTAADHLRPGTDQAAVDAQADTKVLPMSSPDMPCNKALPEKVQAALRRRYTTQEMLQLQEQCTVAPAGWPLDTTAVDGLKLLPHKDYIYPEQPAVATDECNDYKQHKAHRVSLKPRHLAWADQVEVRAAVTVWCLTAYKTPGLPSTVADPHSQQHLLLRCPAVAPPVQLTWCTVERQPAWQLR